VGGLSGICVYTAGWLLILKLKGIIDFCLFSLISPKVVGTTYKMEQREYIIRNHIHPNIKSEYKMEENPRELWNNLKQRYEQQKAIVLPEATHEWNHLRLQDFKTFIS